MFEVLIERLRRDVRNAMPLGPRFLRWRIVRPAGPMDVELDEFERWPLYLFRGERGEGGIKRSFL